MKYTKSSVIIWVILFIAFVIRVAASCTPDMYGDDTLYSFRAFGWTDDFGPLAETGPLGWFGSIPWWGNLSFHDHPPLVFAIQHIFFWIFGDGTFVARLPFILIGLLVVWLVYRYLLSKRGLAAAITGSLVAAFGFMSIWVVTAGLLEGVLMLWIFLALVVSYELVFGDEKKRIRNLYYLAIVAALAILTKYTSLFIFLPALAACIAVAKKHHTKKDITHYIISVLVFFAILSPLIIYNVKVYETRGHLDMAASSIVGIQSSDFGVIEDRATAAHGIGGIADTFWAYSHLASLPLIILFGTCLVVLLVQVLRRKTDSLEGWLLVYWCAFFVMVSFSGITERMLPMLVPLIAITIGLAAHRALLYKRNIFLAVFVLIGIFEAVYTVNTLFFQKEYSGGFFSSQNKIQSLGYNELDKEIRKLSSPLPASKSVRNMQAFEFDAEDMQGHPAVVTDNRLNWNASLWYFKRYFYFYHLPFMPTIYLTGTSRGEKISINELFSTTERPVYFVYPLSTRVLDPAKIGDKRSEDFSKRLSEYLIKNKFSYTDINDAYGRPAFRLFKIDKEIDFKQ